MNNYSLSYRKLFCRFWPYVWSDNSLWYKLILVASFILLICSKVSFALIPIFFKHIIDSLSQPSQSLALVLPIGFIIAYGSARVFSQIFNELKDVIFANIAQQATRNLAVKVFRHLYDLGLEFHLDKKTGSLANALQKGVKAIEKLLTFAMFFTFPTFFEILFICVVLQIYYPFIYLIITIAILVLYVVYTIMVSHWRTLYIYKMNEADNHAIAAAVDGLINYETVRYFVNEDYETNKFAELLRKYSRIVLLNRNTLMTLNVGQNIIISVGLTALMIIAGYHITLNTLTIGDFVLLNTYLLQLYQPLNNLGFAYREIKTSIIDMNAIFDILDKEPAIQDQDNAISFNAKNPSVEFRSVCFNYPVRQDTINNLSFSVLPGQTLAIVGASGAGKSTLPKLIFRFYDVSSGEIIINGHNIRDYKQEEFRKIIGIVPQDNTLFNDTILHNITYAKPLATMDEVVDVAKMAEIHDFIMTLTHQYDSLVGERGLKLSGGEKQRISIARMLLKNPSIMIFDEATSALDTKTEKAIQKTLGKVSQGKTTLIIAHRLSTIIHADQIIVLEKGQIAEQGSHKQLLAKRGIYHEMWSQQKKTIREGF